MINNKRFGGRMFWLPGSNDLPGNDSEQSEPVDVPGGDKLPGENDGRSDRDEFVDSLLEVEGNEGDTIVLQLVEPDPRPFLETPFEDYTVTEGLLLALLLGLFLSCVIKIIKGGFYWLM